MQPTKLLAEQSRNVGRKGLESKMLLHQRLGVREQFGHQNMVLPVVVEMTRNGRGQRRQVGRLARYLIAVRFGCEMGDALRIPGLDLLDEEPLRRSSAYLEISIMPREIGDHHVVIDDRVIAKQIPIEKIVNDVATL